VCACTGRPILLTTDVQCSRSSSAAAGGRKGFSSCTVLEFLARSLDKAVGMTRDILSFYSNLEKSGGHSRRISPSLTRHVIRFRFPHLEKSGGHPPFFNPASNGRKKYRLTLVNIRMVAWYVLLCVSLFALTRWTQRHRARARTSRPDSDRQDGD
jgi:hypothetical protein